MRSLDAHLEQRLRRRIARHRPVEVLCRRHLAAAQARRLSCVLQVGRQDVALERRKLDRCRARPTDAEGLLGRVEGEAEHCGVAVEAEAVRRELGVEVVRLRLLRRRAGRAMDIRLRIVAKLSAFAQIRRGDLAWTVSGV